MCQWCQCKLAPRRRAGLDIVLEVVQDVPADLRLGRALGVPLRGINDLLHAAGLAAAYPHIPLKAVDLAKFWSAIDALLVAHLQYPALFGVVVTGWNVVRDFLTDPRSAALVDNCRRWRGRGSTASAPTLTAVPSTWNWRSCCGWPSQHWPRFRPEASPAQLTVCPRFRLGGQVVPTTVVTARFDAPAEVTLDELRIELIYPADAAAERFFRRAA